MFYVSLCGPSKGTLRCYTSICDGIIFLQILHLDAGDSLELRMTGGQYIKQITLNIVLTGLGFDYLV